MDLQNSKGQDLSGSGRRSDCRDSSRGDSLFTLQEKSGIVKIFSLQRVRNNPPPYLQERGKNPGVYICETPQG